MALLAIGVSAVSYAQGGPGGFTPPTPAEQVATLKTNIKDLSDAQSAKILAIYTAQTKSNDSLRTAANGDFQSMMPKMQELRTSYTAKIKAVLTADQQKAFDAIPRRGFGGGPGGGGPPRN